MTDDEWARLPEWTRARWAEKVARTFQHGRVLSTREALAWARAAPDAVLEDVFQSEEAGLSAFRIFLATLGHATVKVTETSYETDSTGNGGSRRNEVISEDLLHAYPSAAHAAFAFQRNEDVEVLFDFRHPLLWAGLDVPYPATGDSDGNSDDQRDAPGNEPPPPLDVPAVRRRHVALLRTQDAAIRAFFEGVISRGESLGALCRARQDDVQKIFFGVYDSLSLSRVPGSRPGRRARPDVA